MTLYFKVKEGVDLSNIQPPIASRLFDIAGVFDKNGVECVITSARRAPVGKKSWHHFGLAVDCRANHISNRNVQLKILAELIGLLGPEYDVILHGEGANIHYHIEHDPD